MTMTFLLFRITMASRLFSAEELLGMMEDEEEDEVDDPNEVLAEGSDEEFDDLDEYGIGMCSYKTEQCHNYPFLQCRF